MAAQSTFVVVSEITILALEKLWLVTLLFMQGQFHFGPETLVTTLTTALVFDTAELALWQMKC